MKKIFKALSIAGICACTFSLTAEAVPLRQSPVPSVEKTAAAVNIPTRNTKVNITASGQVKDNAADKSAVLKKDSRSLKSVILNWQEIPDAAMYELVVKNADTGEKVFSKYNIYAAGYQLDDSEADLHGNLLWQVRGLNINKVPVSDYSEPKAVKQGKDFDADWRAVDDRSYDYSGFSKTDEDNYLVEKNVSISPLKLTTHFGEMAYMPVYPVYSWVPVKNTDHYNIDVFKVPDGDFSRTQKIASYTSPQNMDYYDKKAYTDKGLYYFNIQAYDKSNAKIAESQNSYFTVQTDNVKVAALGDSITHGGGAVSTPPSSPLYNWETYAGFPVVNIGFSGNLTADMLKRFDHDVLAFQPKILVVMGGVNDIRTGVKADTVIANLTAIKEKCRKNSIIPVFLTVTSVNPPKMKAVSSLDIADGWQAQREKINKWIKTQDYYVDVAADMTDERGFLADNLTTDGLHPDYEGKKHIGEAVGDYLRLNFEYMLY
ncbi:GDSL-type esterase/lipase family protein [Megamonas hypermegale]|uniref:SGNH/GDSL hydrolase family protein n=1 Tax=Megamonas hypermegale TaxID=158847 RepID=UPI0026EFBFA3|nr:GDSL-type esterase/lipase family protein [Megamonas hypermegale]